jgi:hypothetical protein
MSERAAMPMSTKAGQITKANTKKLAALLQGNPKTMSWNAIKNILLTYHPNKENIPSLDSLLRQALNRACVDRSGRSTLQLILQKLKDLSLPERVRFASTAVRCTNMAALKAIIVDDPYVLFYCSNGDGDGDDDDDSTAMGSGGGTTLLHLVCERHGWNNEIKFILTEILEKNNQSGDDSNNHNHEGLFHEIEDSQMPLTLSMQAGSDLTEIVDYLRGQHPAYLKANLNCVSRIIAEYSLNMQLLSDLIRWYDCALLVSLHPRDGSSPLNFACYYQNEDMIHCLLHNYFDYYRYGEEELATYNCLVQVQNRLLALNDEGMSPLGHLLLNLGDADAENAWRCVESCVRFFTDERESEYLADEVRFSRPQQRFEFPILHLFFSHLWDQVLAKNNCMEILDQIVHRLGIDVCGVDEETGNTVLSIVIGRAATHCATNDTKKIRELSLHIIDYFMDPAAIPSNPADSRPATTRDGSGRLPLHLACEDSLSWKRGLSCIVNANMPALESVDPITGLPPFAHCAVGANSDLESIYELLKLHPGSMDSVLVTR